MLHVGPRWSWVPIAASRAIKDNTTILNEKELISVTINRFRGICISHIVSAIFIICLWNDVRFITGISDKFSGPN